jgi:hypothetical protein
MMFGSYSARWLAIAVCPIVSLVLVGTAPSIGNSQATQIPFTSVPTSATTITFETTPQGNPIGFDTPAANIWASIGVRFDANDEVDGPFALRSPPNVLVGGPLALPPIQATFNPPVTLLGAWGFDFVMEPFDRSGNSLGAFTYTDGSPGLFGGENEFGFLGVTSSTPIATVEFRNAFPEQQANGFHIDDLVFVPLPLPPTQLIAFTEFDEPPLGQDAYMAGETSEELGFSTFTTPSGGLNPLTGVAQLDGGQRVFSHRSVNATTFFDSIDLVSFDDPSVSLEVQIANTSYEAGDSVRAYVTDGTSQIDLFNFAGTAASDPLDQAAGAGFVRYSVAIPNDWAEAALVITSSSNSTQGAERFDFDSIEFRAIPEPGTWGMVLAALVTAVAANARRARCACRGSPGRLRHA